MRMETEKMRIVVPLTIDTSREKSDNLLGLPNVAFVIEQKQLSLCCVLVRNPHMAVTIPFTFRRQ